MAYHLVTVSCEEDEPWGSQLMTELERQEAEGYTLVAMTTRTVAVNQSHGMAATRYEEQLALVFHRP